MKRLVLGLAVLVALGTVNYAAFAQSAAEFKKEYQEFKKKSAVPGEAAQSEDSSAPAVADSADDVPAWLETDARKPASKSASPAKGASVKKTPPVNKRGGNPLGAAANLPVNGQLPATAQALDTRTPEEAQADMEADIAAQKKRLDEASFNDALKGLLPLKPEQIRKVLEAFKESRQAVETPIAMPTPKIEVETISLDPSQTPPVIKTAPGRVTTVTILDQTGSPWAIQDVSWAGKFDVTPPEEGGHVIRITPQTSHGVGNVSIRLVDLITPITFTLQTGLDEVYYRFDARIPKQGPLAKTPLIEYGGLKTVTGGDENLVQILDGTPPDSSEKLKVNGVDGRTNVWRVSGQIYLRTPLTLLSPAWNSSVTSADGMNVYTLNDTPVILLSDEGRMVQAHIAADEVTP